MVFTRASQSGHVPTVHRSANCLPATSDRTAPRKGWLASGSGSSFLTQRPFRRTVRFKRVIEHRWFKPATGAALTALCGLALWKMPLGERWVNASYDYAFRFGARGITNKVVLILMDNEAHDKLDQRRGQPWDRRLHTRLLDRLTADRCPLVVFDVHFRKETVPDVDQSLAAAMRRHGRVALMAKLAEVAHPGLPGAAKTFPAEQFLRSSATNGVAWLDPDLDLIVRRHWPFPASGSEPYRSLPWVAAELAEARLPTTPQGQWLRYYGQRGPWTRLSYHFAEKQATNYFHDKIVFIGSSPETSLPGDEEDEFRTPYTRWTGEAVGGVEILATEFLNLVNGEWLRRPAWGLEVLVIVAFGGLVGGSLSFFRVRTAAALGCALGLVVTLGFIGLSFSTTYWFPWLILSGGQVPLALVWVVTTSRAAAKAGASEAAVVPAAPAPIVAKNYPDTPDYELIQPPFGEGAYGKVWLARNAIGQWQALKAVYQAKFGDNVGPYDREFRGIERYKPVSDKHPGLLRIDFISRKKDDGYFYYVMELGDSLTSGWEASPAAYKPRDLASLRARAAGKRLPVPECVRIVRALAEGLDFLHQQGLTHRDIKPSNIIFVKGHPKLADVGLVAEMRAPMKELTYVGTPGYMPPPPESPGTILADIYGLGMVLYVISTGSDPGFFPEIATTLVEQSGAPDFLRLNAIIIKACQPDSSQRYSTARELAEALLEIERTMGDDVATSPA